MENLELNYMKTKIKLLLERLNGDDRREAVVFEDRPIEMMKFKQYKEENEKIPSDTHATTIPKRGEGLGKKQYI